MKLQTLPALAVIVILLTGCDITDSGDPDKVFEYDFRESEASWELFFSDYNGGWGERMELTSFSTRSF
ncbi:MAG: hypothetical protein WD037_03775 [Balneolales bacterium]